MTAPNNRERILPRLIDDDARLPSAPAEHRIPPLAAGYVSLESEAIGRAPPGGAGGRSPGSFRPRLLEELSWVGKAPDRFDLGLLKEPIRAGRSPSGGWA